VLGISFVCEGASWCIAVRALNRGERGRTFWQRLHHSKDPSKFMIIGEDTAALLGILVAFGGVALGERLGSDWPDAVASMIIGGILCGVAMYLVYETKHLLIGEAADPEVVRGVRELTTRHSGVRRVRLPATVYLGPEEVVLILHVHFDPELGADELARTIEDIERSIKAEYAEMKHIVIEADVIEADVIEAERRITRGSAPAPPRWTIGDHVDDGDEQGAADDRPDDGEGLAVDAHREELGQVHRARDEQPEQRADEAHGYRDEEAARRAASDRSSQSAADASDDEQ